ncbi:hypothetical protein ES703_105357 [subsurface metagenome]
MPELDNLIRFYKTVLSGSGYLLSPSVRSLTEQTIKALEELKKLKGGNQC